MNILRNMQSSIALLGYLFFTSFGCKGSYVNEQQRHTTAAKKTMTAIATLEPKATNHRIDIHLTIRNTSARASLRVEKWQLFQPQLSLGSLVELTCEGKSVAYIGPMAKLAASKEADLLRMKPGATLTGNAEITNLFAFLDGKHVYQVSYDAFIKSVGDAGEDTGLLEIKSEPATFSFDK